MADRQDTSTEHELQSLHVKQRQAINDAFAQLEGEKTVQSFNAFTLEEALDLQIERIEGESTRIRPNELDRTERVYQNLTTAAEELKKIPPEMFLSKDSSRDVNTPEVPEQE